MSAGVIDWKVNFRMADQPGAIGKPFGVKADRSLDLPHISNARYPSR